MKRRSIKPGFELIFAFSLIAIIGLPPFVFAQSTRDVEIKITNGDTVVNGKNIKDLSPADRNAALKDIRNLDNANFRHRGFNRDTVRHRVIIADKDFYSRNDTAAHHFKFRFRNPNGKDSAMVFNYRMNPGRDMEFEPRPFNFRDRDMEMPMRGRGFGMMHRNTQSFEYSNTGSDGITTHVSFRVSEASPEKTKHLTGSDKADLELKDLNLVPEFSSGKIVLIFSLAARTTAEVKLMDHDGKVIWSDRALNGSFNKSFPLGLNGIYLLEVKQGSKVALKRILKEE